MRITMKGIKQLYPLNNRYYDRYFCTDLPRIAETL